MNLDKIRHIGDFYVDEETGEKLSAKQLQSRLKENAHRIFRDEYISWITELGLNNELDLKTLPKKTNDMVSVKEGYKYNSMYEVELRKIMTSDKLGVYEVAFIGKLTPFIQYPNNEIRIYNEYKTLEELAKFIGFGRTTMKNVRKNLEKEEIIKVVEGGNKPPIIYFNPFLYSSGIDIKTDTYMMFVDSKYNPNLSRDMKIHKDNIVITNKAKGEEIAVIH